MHTDAVDTVKYGKNLQFGLCCWPKSFTRDARNGDDSHHNNLAFSSNKFFLERVRDNAKRMLRSRVCFCFYLMVASMLLFSYRLRYSQVFFLFFFVSLIPDKSYVLSLVFCGEILFLVVILMKVVLNYESS